MEELKTESAYRVCAVSYDEFRSDLIPPAENDEVDRTGFLRTLRAFAAANRLKLDWEEIKKVPSETLVNALSMMSPFSASEKQALLEAGSLKERTEVLIAITEIELVRSGRATRSMQ
jgi:Lon protease-like protein